MFDTFGLGAGLPMVNDFLVTGGVASLEWFQSGVYRFFVARPTDRDVKRYFRWSCGTPLGMETRCAH